MLVDGRDVLPNYLRVCLTMTGKTLADRRDEAIDFVAAEMDALRFAVSHRDETIALTREVIQAKPDDPRPAYAFDDTVKHGAVDPAVTAADGQVELDAKRTGEGRQSEDADRSRQDHRARTSAPRRPSVPAK